MKIRIVQIREFDYEVQKEVLHWCGGMWETTNHFIMKSRIHNDYTYHGNGNTKIFPTLEAAIEEVERVFLLLSKLPRTIKEIEI